MNNYWDNEQNVIRLNQIAMTCFRDVADIDYVLSRFCFFGRLEIHAYYLASQAIEKYLKSILLFNQRKAPKGHKLRCLCDEIVKLSHVNLDSSKEFYSFLEELEWKGQNRYFSYAAFWNSRDLEKIDHMVWDLRRYALDISGMEKDASGCDVPRKIRLLRYIHDPAWIKQPWKFRSPSKGKIEELLDDADESLREYLLMNNRYFGYGDQAIASGLAGESGGFRNPPHVLPSYDQEFIDELGKLVFFPNPVFEGLKRLKE